MSDAAAVFAGPGGELTERQAQVLGFILAHLEGHQRPPSHTELCEAFGWRSPNAARSMLLEIERRGYIERVKGGSIRVLFNPEGIEVAVRVERRFVGRVRGPGEPGMALAPRRRPAQARQIRTLVACARTGSGTAAQRAAGLALLRYEGEALAHLEQRLEALGPPLEGAVDELRRRSAAITLEAAARLVAAALGDEDD